MAELLTTTQGSTTTVHPWYQLFKTRLTHVALDEITMVPNVEITINEEEKKHFEKNGMLTPMVVDENNLYESVSSRGEGGFGSSGTK